MELVKFDRVVSVNSEVSNHSAKNLLSYEVSSQKSWLCEKGTEKGILILQLEKATTISSIHIGNAHSAFIEVLVGRATDDNNEYQSLILTSSFMSLIESKTGKNPNSVRFFTKKEFTSDVCTKMWDRVKIVCSQPFNKQIQYGLCFIKVHGEQNKKKEIDLSFLKQREEESSKLVVGSFFTKRKEKQSVAEQLRDAEKPENLLQHTPLNPSKIASKLSKNQSTEKKSKKNNEDEDEEIYQKDNRKNRDLGLVEEDERKEKVKKNKVEKPDKKKHKTRSFKKLLEDVTFVLSGFKNPLRGNIRSMAVEMGAKYQGDWVDGSSTHLICAYANTPKFNEVKGKGKIVKREWIEECYKNKIRYPWRRFALDKQDLKQVESEEEILTSDVSDIQVGPSSSKRSTKDDQASPEGKHKRQKVETDVDKVEDAQVYDVATDSEDEPMVDTTDYPMPFLPDFFSTKTFFVDDNIKNKQTIERYVIAYHGIVTETLNEDVEFYVTEKGGTVLQIFKKKVPNLIAVQPDWIWKINQQQKYIPMTNFILK